MNHVAKVVCILAVWLVTASSALAEMIAVRDEASVDLPKGFFGVAEPTPELKQNARNQAVEKAWRRYQAQNLSGARAAQFDKYRDALQSQLKDLCTFTPYEERVDKETAIFSVKVRGWCDQQRVDHAINKLILETKGERGIEELPNFVFMFLTRRADQAINSQAKQAAGTSATTVQRDTQYVWKAEQSDDVNNAVMNVLTTAGYQVVKYSDLVSHEDCSDAPPLDEVMTTFVDQWKKQAELIPGDVRARIHAVAKAKKCEISFFGWGILEILNAVPLPDGSVDVTVKLAISVDDLRKKFPITAASIAGRVFHQKGPDRITAAALAMQQAVSDGTREIVDLLRLNASR